MIIANEKVVSQTDGIGNVTKAKVNANARIFNFFSTMVYSNPYIAIIRELTANGVDAMCDAGRSDKPMTITLPTDFTPFMVFRDYGTGMSHEFMMGDPGFMTYTESTKTDDPNAIGGFGIGSKAPLSYTAQFTIKSFIDGVVNIYTVFKDEDDCPSIAHLGTSDTTEPNGVEIMFPVEGSDVQNFRDAAFQCLTYFNPLPNLINSAEQLVGPEYTVCTPSWGFKKGATGSRVVMGGVAYPLAKGQVREIDDFLDYGIDFYAPIGSCSIALSREALQYDDKTTRVLKTMVEAIRPDIEKYVAEMFDNCNSLWEAEALYSELVTGSGNPHRQRMIRGNASYKGVKLTGRVKPISGTAGKIQIAQITSSRYSKTNYSYWTEGTASPTMRAWINDLTPNDISVVLLDDAPNRPVLRMRNYLQNNDISRRGVLIIRTLPGVEFSKMDWGRLLVKLGRPPVKWLSQIDPLTVARAPSMPRVKRILAYPAAKNLSGPRSGSSASVNVLPATGGYYIKMTGFSIDSGQITNDQLIASGIKPDQLFYFNKQDFIDSGIEDDPNWKPAIEAYEARVKTYKQEYRNLALASAFHKLRQDRAAYNSRYKSAYIFELFDKIQMPPRGPLYQLTKLYELVKDQMTHEHMTMRTLLDVKYDDKFNLLTGLLAAAELQYPEAFHLVTSDRYVRSGYEGIYKKLIGVS